MPCRISCARCATTVVPHVRASKALQAGQHVRQLYVTGDAVDFISYPQGLSKDDVKDVMPHAGIKGLYVDGPDYYWCPFSE